MVGAPDGRDQRTAAQIVRRLRLSPGTRTCEVRLIDMAVLSEHPVVYAGSCPFLRRASAPSLATPSARWASSTFSCDIGFSRSAAATRASPDQDLLANDSPGGDLTRTARVAAKPLALFTLAEEIGVRQPAARSGVHQQLDLLRREGEGRQWGLEPLQVRERRRLRMPNQIGPQLEQRVIAFSLGHPGFGARRISAEFARAKWGGLRISEHGLWRVLRRFGLNTRSRRLPRRP